MLPLISQLLVSELSLLLVEWLFPNKKKQQKRRQMMILVNVSYQLHPSVFKTYHRNQRR
jgi:uncharacterized membrane protein YkvA (DUF1232 family)